METKGCLGWLYQLFCYIWRWLCLIRKLFQGQPENERSYDMTECIYGWTVAYRIEEDRERCVIRITVRIKLEPDDDVTQDELDDLKDLWEPVIEERWSGEFEIVRLCEHSAEKCPCEEYSVDVDIEFVDEDPHHTVRVRRGPARSNMTTWDTEDSAGTAAHEVGHMLGHPDEYADPNCPDREVTNDNSIMQTTGGSPRRRHYQPFANWISQRTCCRYGVSQAGE